MHTACKLLAHNSSNLCCMFVYSSRTVRVGYAYRRLSNTDNEHVHAWACARLTHYHDASSVPGPSLQQGCKSFDALVLQISLESSSISWYK